MEKSRPAVKIGDRVRVLESSGKRIGYEGKIGLVKVVVADLIYVGWKGDWCVATQWELLPKRGRPKKEKHICDITKKAYKELREENAKLKQRIEELEKPEAKDCKVQVGIYDIGLDDFISAVLKNTWGTVNFKLKLLNNSTVTFTVEENETNNQKH